MKKTLIKILAFVTHPRRLCAEGSAIVASRLRIRKGTFFKTDHAEIKKSVFSVSGEGNRIELGKADIYNSTILIEGSNCSLQIGDNTRIYNLKLQIKSDNCLVSIGQCTTFAGGTIVCAGNGNQITVGKRCMIAEGVDIWNSDTHMITIQGKEITNHQPITIMDHVWLGKGATVLKGVTIGANAIVGMKSVVTHDINPGTVNAGVPAAEIRDGANWHR